MIEQDLTGNGNDVIVVDLATLRQLDTTEVRTPAVSKVATSDYHRVACWLPRTCTSLCSCAVAGSDQNVRSTHACSCHQSCPASQPA